MEISQCLLQAIPTGGSPLLQLPGVDKNVLRDVRMFSQGKSPVTNIQDLLSLDSKQQRKVLARLDDKRFQQAINIAKNIPILVVSNVHFKGTKHPLLLVTHDSRWR